MPTNPLSGKDVYNAIMAQIEPELVEAMLPTLDAKYAGETKEDHATRMSRYEKAFAEYDKRFATFLTELQQEVHQIQRNARTTAEQKAQAEDAKAEAALLSQIDSL